MFSLVYSSLSVGLITHSNGMKKKSNVLIFHNTDSDATLPTLKTVINYKGCRKCRLPRYISCFWWLVACQNTFENHQIKYAKIRNIPENELLNSQGRPLHETQKKLFPNISPFALWAKLSKNDICCFYNKCLSCKAIFYFISLRLFEDCMLILIFISQSTDLP